MNQITEPANEQNDTTPPSVAAGQRLREAREGLGLTRDDVARELRLQEKLIGALEAGDRSQLPPDTFISGYLRAYARLLGWPAEQLIAEYLADRNTPSVYRATDRTGMPMMSVRDPKFRYTSFVVIAGLMLLFVAWWASQRFTLDSFAPPLSGVADDEQQEIEASLPDPMPLYQDPSAEIAPTAEGPSEATSPSAPSTPEPALAGGNAAPAESAAPAVTAPAVAAVEAPKLPQPAPVVVAEPLTPATPQSLLVMEYQAASWTQVEDANGRVLAYEVVNPGRKLELHGVAPFKVFLGYAPGVLVYYKGTLFSHAPYQRGELARFRVGSSQDNQPLTR